MNALPNLRLWHCTRYASHIAEIAHRDVDGTLVLDVRGISCSEHLQSAMNLVRLAWPGTTRQWIPGATDGAECGMFAAYSPGFLDSPPAPTDLIGPGGIVHAAITLGTGGHILRLDPDGTTTDLGDPDTPIHDTLRQRYARALTPPDGIPVTTIDNLTTTAAANRLRHADAELAAYRLADALLGEAAGEPNLTEQDLELEEPPEKTLGRALRRAIEIMDEDQDRADACIRCDTLPCECDVVLTRPASEELLEETDPPVLTREQAFDRFSDDARYDDELCGEHSAERPCAHCWATYRDDWPLGGPAQVPDPFWPGTWDDLRTWETPPTDHIPLPMVCQDCNTNPCMCADVARRLLDYLMTPEDQQQPADDA